MASEKADQRSDAEAIERIVVALDASPNSVAALRAAAELASWLDVELEGLYIEDINLTRLSGFPFQKEVGSYTGAVRRLDDLALQRQLRALAASIQQAMAREASRRPLRWTFQVRRGRVVTELLAASRSATVVSMGRRSRGRRRQLGSTAASVLRESPRPVLVLSEEGELRLPLTVVYTGSEASERALRFAVNLQYRNHGDLRVLVWSRGDRQREEELSRSVEVMLRKAAVEARIVPVTGRELGAALAQEGGTLVVARENAALLSEHEGATILVP